MLNLKTNLVSSFLFFICSLCLVMLCVGCIKLAMEEGSSSLQHKTQVCAALIIGIALASTLLTRSSKSRVVSSTSPFVFKMSDPETRLFILHF